MLKLSGNRYAICNHALFGKEFIKRRVLWDRSASFPEKAQALSSMAAALGVNMTPRALYSYCIRFRKVHEKKIHAYLLASIKKQLRPELALKQAGVPAWVRELDSELHVLPRLIDQFRTAGLLPPEDRSHVMWSEFVNKMAARCHTVRRLPSSEDIVAVLDELGLGNNSFDLWKKLWHEQSKTILYKYRCLSESGDRPSEVVALTQLEWKVVDLIALYMNRFSVVYDFIFKEKVDYEPEVLQMAIATVLSKEMGVTRASKYYLVPQSTLAYKVKLLKSGKELPKGTLKSNIQVKQLVKLYHLVKMYRIEENDSDDQMKQKWAMVVRSYARCDETSPSGIVLQMRWHELKSLARKNILRRIQDKNCKVHPLMVEIATKYPHIMKDSHTWADKVHSGNVYDVTNVPIKMDYYYSVEESEERPTNEQVLDKNAEVDSDFDSDEERPLVIADNATPVASTSKKRTKLTEFSMPRLDIDEDPNKTNHDLTNVNNSPVDNLRNKELTRLDDELSSQFRSIIADDISKVEPEINRVTDKIEKKIDIMDEELEKLSKEFNKQFNALKNLNSRTNSNLGKSGVSIGNKDVATKTKSKGESNSELSKDNETNDNTTVKCNNATHIKQYGPKKPCTVTVLENNAKFSTQRKKMSKRKKDDGNNNPENKSESPNNKLLPDGVIATIYTCKAPDGSELGHVVVPTPINKDSVTLTVKTNDGPVTFNSTVINNPQTGNIDVPKENDSLNTSKESDFDLLQKIDPTQAETVLIFSDSDNEESDLPKANENAQDSKKVYNLNDVKKYLSSHSLDDILMKMDDINVKKINRRSASYIHVSDSDEEAKENGKRNASDDKIFNIDDSDVSINEEDPKDDNVVSVIPNENSSLLIPNLNVPNNTKIIAFNVKTPDSNATNIEVSVKVERDFEEDSNNQIRDSPSLSKVRKKTLDVKEDTEALPAGLNLFRLQDRQSKETLGVLVNVKNSIKTSELGIQLSKKVDEYLNGSTDKDSTENRNKLVNDNKEYYNVINKKLEIEKVNEWTDVLLKKVLDSSSKKPLWTSEIQENNNEDEGTSKTSIDPKLIMDTRVYLPKLDEIQTYNKNRRANFSINLKRISNLGNKILNYKRKSDDPIRVQDDIESEISEAAKRKATDALDNVVAKRIRKSSDDTSITPYNPNSVIRKTVSNLATNIVQRIKFESDDESLSNEFEHTINDLENNHEKNNVYVKTENVKTNDASLNEHIMDIRKMLPEKDINMTLSDDNENSNYGSDAMELDDTIQNNTLLLDATNSNNPHEKESNNINSENINSKLLEFINDTNNFRFDNTEKDTSDKQNLTEKKTARNQIDYKLNETSNRLAVSVINVDENNDTDVENDTNEAQDTSSDDDMDLKTLKKQKASSIEESESIKKEYHNDGNGKVEEVDSDDDPGPINNIAEMLKLCKPVKLCLERVEVPTDNIQVRKVELPDRTSLKRHRAPTAHVAPISVTLPLDCDSNDGKATESQLGSLLQLLSMETASEWQRLEESVKNTSQVKRPRLHDHTYTRYRKEKGKSSCKKEDKKQEKIVIKSKTPDPDELQLQNKEWERQKTMNNRFFDLTPKYKRPTVVPAKGEKDAKEKLNKTEHSLPKKPDEETLETEMAITSLINDLNNDTPKNNDINNAKSVEKHDSYDVITFHGLNPLQEVPGINKPVSTPAPLSAPQEPVNVNVLTPLFTKVKKEVKNKGKKEVEKKEKKVELVPIPTKVTFDNSLLTLKMPRRYTEAKSNEQRSHTDKSQPGTVMTDKDQAPVLPSTSKDAQSKLLPSSSKSSECHYISDDSGPAFEKSNTVNVKATIDETPGKHVNIKELKQATKHKETSVKKSRRQIKSKTLQPVETITLSDSDTDTVSQTDYANVVIDKFEIQDEQIQINVNPPIKVMESTLIKTGSKHVLKMMEIGPINDELLKKIDNLLNKRQDTPKRVDGSIIKNISSIIDLGDSSDEDKDDKNNHKLDSITPEFSKTPLESQENGQMPQITSVTSIGPSIDITSKKNSGTKPINSDDEYFDSDSDELYIDDNPTISNKGKVNVQTESEFSSPIKLKFPEPKITEIKSLSVIKNNIQATDNIATSNIKSTENVPIYPKTVVVEIIDLHNEEPSIPPLSNTENDIRIQDNSYDSTGTNIPSIDENVFPENNNDNINSDCGDNPKIDENNSNSIADSKSNENICSNDADINEEVKSNEENEITDANNEDLTPKLTDDNTDIQLDNINYPDHKDETININKDETIANKNDEAFENNKGETIDNKKDNTIDNKKDDTIDNKKDDTIDNKKDETIDNKKDDTIDNKKDDTIDNKKNETINNKKDETIDNKKDETIHNKYDESIDDKYDETIDIEKDETIDNKTDETIDNKKDETNDNKGDETIDIKTDETIDNKKDETIENKYDETIDNKYDESINNKRDEFIDNKNDETIEIEKGETMDIKQDDTIANKKDESIDNIRDETIHSKKYDTIQNERDDTIDNKKDETIDNEKDESTDNKTVETNDKTDETVDNKKDDTNDNKKDDKPTDNDPKPRPFLKLVPIQKLLDESKVEPKVTNEPKIFEDTLPGVENSEYEDDLFSKDVFDTQESKMRGEPIPFLCSTKSDVTEVSNLPTISNVVSLSSGVKKPVFQTITNPENADFLTAKKSMTKPVMLSKGNLQFFLDNPSSSSDERLKSWEISTLTPILVTDFIKNRDCTNISLLCIDESKPLWKVYKDYLIVTNLKLPLQEPSYWSVGGRRTCAKIIMDDSAKGSTVVGEVSIPDEIFLDNHWYRKLSTEPMIYAKVWFVVPNSKTCLDMINLDMDMQLYSNNTGTMTPMKKTVIKFLPVGDKSKVTDSGEVISLDSDDE